MNKTHTPGPWTMGTPDATDSAMVQGPSTTVATVWRNTANARLIAAAPTLLEVLREVADFWAGGDVPEELDKKMRATIAAAEGTR